MELADPFVSKNDLEVIIPPEEIPTAGTSIVTLYLLPLRICAIEQT